LNAYEFITDEPTTVRAADLPEAVRKAGLDGPMLVIDITELRRLPGRYFLAHPIREVAMVAYDQNSRRVGEFPLRQRGEQASNGATEWAMDSRDELRAERVAVYLKFSTSPVLITMDCARNVSAGDEVTITLRAMTLGVV
jgi:hypothetical protein